MGQRELDELRALRARAENELYPHRTLLPAERLPEARRINEEILARDPTDHAAALRISVVHLVWSQHTSSDAVRRHHQDLRVSWLLEALARDPPTRTRATIDAALRSLSRLTTSQELAQRREAMAKLEVMTVPMTLVALARSFREDVPRLPHLACVASRRAVRYADRGTADDPRGEEERYRAQASLAASYRAVRRWKDARSIAQQLVSQEPANPIGWTVLIASTRDLAGGIDAAPLVRRAIAACELEELERDEKFINAVIPCLLAAQEHEMAAHWIGCGLRSESMTVDPRRRATVLQQAGELIPLLRTRGQHQLAHELQVLLDLAGPGDKAAA